MMYTREILTIAGMIVSAFFAYHKFIMSEVEKKVDQKVYDKEMDGVKQLVKNNYSNLNDKVDGVLGDVKIIKEHILKTK